MALDEALEERIWAILERLRSRWRNLDEDAMRAGNRKQALVPRRARRCSSRWAPRRGSWSAGLGYNRRAVNLQRAARAVVDAGGFPRTPEELRMLPGIGPYTASAVACFAFDAQLTTVDVNARRVLARALGRDDAPPPTGRAWEWNQALFDLGATVCLARIPRCERCPLAEGCPSRGLRFEPLRKQGPFEGSSRARRAALVRALHAGPRPASDYDAATLEGLERDGLVILRDGLVALPEEVSR